MPIHKGPVPPSLARYAAIPGTTYDGGAAPDGSTFTEVKEEIRQHLVREQGHLCAYCMGRIRPTEAEMKVEHWASQESHGHLQLEYSNMLGCCCGKTSNRVAHCDGSKENRPLSLNPSNPAHHPRMRIRYKPNGEIASDDPTFDGELRAVLNLNAARLVANRKAIWERVTLELSRAPGAAKRSTVESLKNRWKTRNAADELPPYCGVAIQYIEKRLARMG